MSKMIKSIALALAIAAAGVMHNVADASAQSANPAARAQMQAAKAQAMKAQAMKMQAAKMQKMQARKAQAAMATTMAAVATLAASDSAECSPYLAKWLMTRNPTWKIAYDACMDD